MSEKGEKMKRITVASAAGQMGVSAQFVRIGLQRGTLPIGYAVKMSKNRYTYCIFQELIDGLVDRNGKEVIG